MVESVKILAHDLSLPPLLGHLLFGKGSEKDGGYGEVGKEPEFPGWRDSRSGSIGEVTLLDVEHVECGEEGGEDG